MSAAVHPESTGARARAEAVAMLDVAIREGITGRIEIHLRKGKLTGAEVTHSVHFETEPKDLMPRR